MRGNNLKNIKKTKNFLKNYSNDKFLPFQIANISRKKLNN